MKPSIDITKILAKTWLDKYDTIPNIGDEIEIRGGPSIIVSERIRNAIILERDKSSTKISQIGKT